MMTDSEQKTGRWVLRPTLALMLRALTVDARSWSTYITRAVFVGIILFMLAQYQIASRMMGAPGLSLLRTVMFMDLVFFGFLAMSYISTAISEEKEEMTLGLLRMTRLSGVSILLGKGLSRVAMLVLLVVAQLPFTMLAVTLGGVSPGQVAAAYATVLGFMVLLGGVGLFASVVSRRSGSAGGLTLTILLGLFVGPYLVKFLADFLNKESALLRNKLDWVDGPVLFARACSPFERMGEVLATGFGGVPVGTQVIANVVLGAAFFLLAWALFDFFSREQKEEAPGRGLLARGGKRRWFLSPGAVWTRALIWKDFNFLAGGRPGMIGRFIFYPLLIGGLSWIILATDGPSRREFFQDVLPGLSVGTMSVALALELAYAASRVFNLEMRWGTLGNLGALPIPMRRIARDKALGCLIGAIPALIYWLLLTPVWIGKVADEPEAFGVIIMFALHVICFLHLVALLSVYLKYGAFIVALFAWWFGMMFFGFLFAMTAFFGGIGVAVATLMTAATLLPLAILMQKMIVHRLRTLAA